MTIANGKDKTSSGQNGKKVGYHFIMHFKAKRKIEVLNFHFTGISWQYAV
jgi:hypothetical protein